MNLPCVLHDFKQLFSWNTCKPSFASLSDHIYLKSEVTFGYALSVLRIFQLHLNHWILFCGITLFWNNLDFLNKVWHDFSSFYDSMDKSVFPIKNDINISTFFLTAISRCAPTKYLHLIERLHHSFAGLNAKSWH